MFSYDEINAYLDTFQLPMSFEAIVEYEYDIGGDKYELLKSVSKFLVNHISAEEYEQGIVNCTGACLVNLTQIGVYFLLDDEVVFVHTSSLRPFGEETNWALKRHRFIDIVELEFSVDENHEAHHETGKIFMKLRNDKGNERSKIIRKVNPEHFDIMRDYHTKSMFNRHV